MRNLALLPKAHLHLHLEAGMSTELLVELARKYKRDVPVISGYGNFAAFSDTYVAATDVLRDRSDWELLAADICRSHVEDGAVYLEPAFWAGNYRHIFESDEQCWDLVFEVFDGAASSSGLELKFMVPVDRVKDSPDEAMALARFAIRNQDRVVSFGLHNDEVGHPPGDFVDAFHHAVNGGLLSTPHAGELESGQFVVDSLDLLSADRIGHGVRSVELPALLDRLASEDVCLDVCPTSNIMLGVYPNFEAHPLPQILEAGISFSINADDPILFGSTLLGEYEVCRREFGFDDDCIAGIARTSIEFSSASEAVKFAAVGGIDDWLKSEQN
jgi:adenosine deaminase